jgi:hypothetical protein
VFSPLLGPRPCVRYVYVQYSSGDRQKGVLVEYGKIAGLGLDCTVGLGWAGLHGRGEGEGAGSGRWAGRGCHAEAL